MKRRVLLFLAIVAGALLALPALNIGAALVAAQPVQWTPKRVFSFDLPAGWASRLLYPLGISTEPAQVVIGREGWLYLGDQYHVRSAARRGQTKADIARSQRAARAAAAWDAWLQARNVRLYRMMIGPDKGSIYPEYLPQWAQPVTPGPTEAVTASHGPWLVDLRPALRAAKATAPAALYYRTDTHWNALGAGIAFRAFAEQVRPAAPELVWPGEEVAQLRELRSIPGGDLAHMLRMSALTTDAEPLTRGTEAALQTAHYDLATGKLLAQGLNERIGPPQEPLRVVSPGALNARKVLWLRDSFGTALSPLMAATFTDVVQWHWNVAFDNPDKLADLVQKLRPDYVFMTIVERDARSNALARMPPAARAD